jgi:hypothetical protein
VVVDVMRPDQGGKMQEKETLDEKLPGLFEPDTLLPIQYFEAMRRKHLLEGEKRLILSVLEDAIECFMKCIDSSTSKGQRLFRDADEWIELEDKHWVFSFDNVCDMLDINPEYMRRGLKNWKEKKLVAMQERAASMSASSTVETAAVETPAVEPVEVRNVEPEVKPAVAAKPLPGRGSKVFTPRHARGKSASMSNGRAGARSFRKVHA